jgi:hypothetical protein
MIGRNFNPEEKRDKRNVPVQVVVKDYLRFHQTEVCSV